MATLPLSSPPSSTRPPADSNHPNGNLLNNRSSNNSSSSSSSKHPPRSANHYNYQNQRMTFSFKQVNNGGTPFTFSWTNTSGQNMPPAAKEVFDRAMKMVNQATAEKFGNGMNGFNRGGGSGGNGLQLQVGNNSGARGIGNGRRGGSGSSSEDVNVGREIEKMMEDVMNNMPADMKRKAKEIRDRMKKFGS